ncbi:MAG: complex I NDUFA9 subunit family protein [Alphaproteobacteria bacterium]|nr:complex I NDUFA9 subunit family protein [Alphaproteobacteria bacterium]
MRDFPSFFRPTQATVFGGSGFLGRSIVRHLAQKDVTLRVPTRDLEKARSLQPSGQVGQIIPFLCATRRDSDVARAIEGADTVANLIGISSENRRNSFQSIHVEIAARIARIAREEGVKNFIHISALDANATSASGFARSKAAGEEAVRAFFPDAIILRPATMFGPDDAFLNLFAIMARYSPVLPLVGFGKTKLQPVYVGDVAEAVILALSTPAARGQIFALGGPTIYSFREILELMLRVTERSCSLLPFPWWLSKTSAYFWEILPRPLLTRDQIERFKKHSLVGNKGTKTFQDLGLTPLPLEVILPTYCV